MKQLESKTNSLDERNKTYFYPLWCGFISDCTINHECIRTNSGVSEDSIQFNNELLRNRSFLKATRHGNYFKCDKIFNHTMTPKLNYILNFFTTSSTNIFKCNK